MSSKTTAMAAFLNLDFYKAPVVLEDVGDDHLLGFTVSITNKQITFILPEGRWKNRGANSAGSTSMGLSGLQSRLHTICRCTFPKSLIQEGCQRLCNKYIELGSNKQRVLTMMTKVLTNYRRKGQTQTARSLTKLRSRHKQHEQWLPGT